MRTGSTRAKEIADKYIAPDGSEPKPDVVYVKTIRKELADQGKTGMVIAVARFIAWHDDKHMQGGYTAKQAWAAFCAILDISDDDKFRKIFRQD
jgi:hypothetical protein